MIMRTFFGRNIFIDNEWGGWGIGGSDQNLLKSVATSDGTNGEVGCKKSPDKPRPPSILFLKFFLTLHT